MKTDKIVLVVVWLIGVVLVSACGPSQADLDATATQTVQAPTATPTVTPTLRPTSTPTPTPPSPQALLESSSTALREANTYHFDMGMQMKSHAQHASTDVSLTMTGDALAPDRVHATMLMSAAGTPIKTEAIIISQTTYVVNPSTGDWEIASAPVAPFLPGMFTAAETKGLESLKLAGKEELDSTPVYHLTATFPMTAAGLLEGDVLIEYWLGSKDILPRQITAHGDLKATALGTTSTLTITLRLSDFGKKVAIEAPRLVLYRADLSDPSSGWPSTKKAQYSSGYQDGSYRMFVNAANMSIWASTNKKVPADVSVETTANKAGGPDANNYGVICRYKDANNYYAFIITSDGRYLIIAIVESQGELLGTDQVQTSSKIKQGSASNVVRADCIGDKLALYVNGSKLMESSDTRLESGDVGLIVGTFDEPGVDIRFTDFAVYQLPQKE